MRAAAMTASKMSRSSTAPSRRTPSWSSRSSRSSRTSLGRPALSQRPEPMSTQYVSGYADPGLSQIAPYLLLIAILLVRPYGLFGETRIERV